MSKCPGCGDNVYGGASGMCSSCKEDADERRRDDSFSEQKRRDRENNKVGGYGIRELVRDIFKRD